MKTKVLFICHGNICRSPMAEFIMKDMVEKRGLISGFQIDSAATSTEEIWNGVGNPIYPPAKSELIRRGIGKTKYTNFSQKRARQVRREDYGQYDLFLCADQMNVRRTLQILGGDRDGKVHLLMDFANRVDWDRNPEIINRNVSISDPWYTGDFRTTYDDIVAGCEGLLAYFEVNKMI